MGKLTHAHLDVAGLAKRLRATAFDDNSTRAPYQRLINPDGPEAADKLELLAAKITALVEGLDEAIRVLSAVKHHLNGDDLLALCALLTQHKDGAA